MDDPVVALMRKNATGNTKGSKCSCRWGLECEALNKCFKKKGDKLRGNPCVRLDLSGDSEAKTKWKRAVFKNLSIDEKDMSNLKKVPINRHHWSPQQLHYFLMKLAKNEPQLQ